MANKPSIPSGTRDFLPLEMRRREYIFDTIRTVFRKYGYAPIETPAMENLSVLTGKYGEEGDRLIFKILNNGDFLKKARHLDDAQKLSFEICDRALRYDLTVPFARYVVMNQNELNFPFKRYQIQPVWRADRPQKGRYREFFQCDADVVGSDSLLYEAEYIAIYDEALSNLGFPGFSIFINNRKILSGYAELVGQPEKVTDICIAIDKLDKIGEEKVKAELEKRGITPEGTTTLFDLLNVSGSNTEKLDHLDKAFADCAIGKEGVAEMREVLDHYQHFDRHNGTLEFNLQLARGLDYYTGTIYEVRAHNVNIGSIGGGGRYADLTGVFGMKGLSGVGISFGADRIYDAMEAQSLFEDISASPVQVMMINFGEETLNTCLEVLNTLRRHGIAAELYPDPIKLGKQFGYADKNGIPFTLVIGTEEMKSGRYQLKNMASGEQSLVNLEEILDVLKSA